MHFSSPASAATCRVDIDEKSFIREVSTLIAKVSTISHNHNDLKVEFSNI